MTGSTGMNWSFNHGGAKDQNHAEQAQESKQKAEAKSKTEDNSKADDMQNTPLSQQVAKMTSHPENDQQTEELNNELGNILEGQDSENDYTQNVSKAMEQTSDKDLDQAKESDVAAKES